MSTIVKKLNDLKAKSILCLGLGDKETFFDQIEGNKLGIDKREGATVAGNVQTEDTTALFEMVVVNGSKDYADLLRAYKQALKNLKEGGLIAVTHTMPKEYADVGEDPAKSSDYCGYAWQLVLDLISLGGLKITSFDLEKGLTFIELNQFIEPKHITVGAFEDWFPNRMKLMTNH